MPRVAHTQSPRLVRLNERAVLQSLLHVLERVRADEERLEYWSVTGRAPNDRVQGPAGIPQSAVEGLGSSWRCDAPREQLLGTRGVAVEDVIESVTSEDDGAVQCDPGEGATAHTVRIARSGRASSSDARSLERASNWSESDR